MMKRASVILALLGWVLPSASFATYTIDGSLSDWGVTPFANWVPNGTAKYTQTDDINLYHAAGYTDSYDMEAMYLDKDSTNLYLGVVSAHALAPMQESGDIGIDLNHDMTISTHGVVTGLEYALLVGSGNMGQVRYNPTWSDTTAEQWSDGWQGSPYRASGGTVAGAGTVQIQYYSSMESGTYILEAAIPWSSLGGNSSVQEIGVHLTTWCGNDSINLVGDFVPPPVPPVVPAPGALLLTSLGAGLVGWLRRGKGQI